jgi:rod shape-determining protein MreC
MFKNRYSSLLTFLFLLGLVVVLFSLKEGHREALRQQALTWASPALRVVERVHDFFTEVDVGLQNRQAAQLEVKQLSTENTRLQMENNFLRDLEKENARLKEMLAFKQESPFRLLACRVISRDPSSWWNTVLINRGWADDKSLDKDLPVVSPRGLVGKTGTVSKYTTEVILLVDENCKVSGMTRGSNAQGIVMGEGNFDQGKPRMRMKFIDRNANLAVGEQVYTSGLGGVFPAGLQIGVVSEVPPLTSALNFGLYREAVIDPVVDLSQFNELFIIVGAK